jgi:uncharacterized protein involved in exopolysaccharide biosynthesis
MKSSETVMFKADSVNLVNLIIKYRITLLITAIAAAIISAAVSLTITPLFRSSVILFPATNVIETQTLFGLQNTSTPLFGDETATEKVLQILRSDNIKDYLVAKYDLMKHYRIGANAKYKYTLLNMRMKKYIMSRKTQYNSVEISVLDSDPQIASSMANDIARQIDTVFNEIVRDAGRKSFIAINNSYNEQLSRVKMLEDSVRLFGPGGYTSIYPVNLKAGSLNSSWGAASLKYSPEFLRLMNMFESENENLSAIRSRLTEAKMLAEQNLPYTHIINRAKVSERKAIPKRTMIVAVGTLSSLLLMIFILGLSDSFSRNGK